MLLVVRGEPLLPLGASFFFRFAPGACLVHGVLICPYDLRGYAYKPILIEQRRRKERETLAPSTAVIRMARPVPRDL